MNYEEKSIYLLKLVNRYNDVIKQAKMILDEECLPAFKNSSSWDSNLRIKTRTTTTVDNKMLATAYPEIYERLYAEGKLVAKAQDLKDEDEEFKSNVLTTTTSTWLEYKDKV